MQNYAHLNLKLKSSDDTQMELKFDVHQNSVAQRWAQSLHAASQSSHILEADRWYNFPGHTLSSLESVVENLERIIQGLNKIHPDLIVINWNGRSPQETINELHVHFADSHLVKNRITEESYSLWFEFNNLLHAFEAVERSKEIEHQAGIPNASMVVTWQNQFKQDLHDEDYTHFTIAKKFGTCYVNYCQVGRHIFEMFQAQDLELDPEHVQPLRSVSADSYFWFGPSTGTQGFAKKSADLKNWFFTHQEYFKNLGLHWGDPKLAIGWIPVATLQGNHDSLEQKKELIQKMARMKHVDSLKVL
jgi:hypothetical protein